MKSFVIINQTKVNGVETVSFTHKMMSDVKGHNGDNFFMKLLLKLILQFDGKKDFVSFELNHRIGFKNDRCFPSFLCANTT